MQVRGIKMKRYETIVVQETEGVISKGYIKVRNLVDGSTTQHHQKTVDDVIRDVNKKGFMLCGIAKGDCGRDSFYLSRECDTYK